MRRQVIVLHCNPQVTTVTAGEAWNYDIWRCWNVFSLHLRLDTILLVTSSFTRVTNQRGLRVTPCTLLLWLYHRKRGYVDTNREAFHPALWLIIWDDLFNNLYTVCRYIVPDNIYVRDINVSQFWYPVTRSFIQVYSHAHIILLIKSLNWLKNRTGSPLNPYS